MKFSIIIIFFIIGLPGVSKTPEGVERSGKLFNYQGTKIYYEECGSGEPLLLLHTFYGTTKQWEDYLELYAKKFSVIAVDMFGHGKSDIHTQGKVFRHADYAKAILALLDYLAIDKTNAIGASSGAIALLYANYFQPHRFKAVVQIGGQIYFGEEFRKWIREERADSANVKYMERYNKLHGPEKAKLLARQFWHFQFLTGDPGITPDMMKTFTASWLVVQGDNDFIGLYHALEMHRHIPESYLWIYPKGGHFPHLVRENIADFARRTTDFISGSH